MPTDSGRNPATGVAPLTQIKIGNYGRILGWN